jgi:hypothetical protein
MTGALFVYRKVNLNETTLDNTWRAVGLIGSKSLEIGADSTCENRRPSGTKRSGRHRGAMHKVIHRFCGYSIRVHFNLSTLAPKFYIV